MGDDRNARTAAAGSVAYLVVTCFVATLGGLLFGYDTAVINGANDFLVTRFALDPIQEGWATSCALVGCIAGAASVGFLSDLLGRKKVLLVSAILFIISAIGTALPETFSAFVIFRFLGGIGVGAASMTSPMYIAEISPARIRGRMVSLNQLAIVFGMLVVYFVNYFISLRGTNVHFVTGCISFPIGNDLWNVETGWRWMFGSETLPALLLLLLLLFVPESPRFLAKKRRRDEALRILARVNGAEGGARELAAIEKSIARETGTLRELLLPGMRLALLIGIALAVFQQVTGINVFLYYGAVIFKQIAGSETSAAMLQAVLVGAVNMAFTVIAIWTVDKIGRKPLMAIGFIGMGVSLFGLGTAAYVQQTDVWILAFMLGYIACFALSVGPVTWVILSEIFPTAIRGRAMAIATLCLWAANYLVSQTFPMMDKSQWLLERFNHAFPFWLYGILSVAALVFLAIFVPETKGKSLEEIERTWHRDDR
ncbi:MAG: sugar porter family MFS transporter [Planctomycetes bacterium]|nr:sugar porter family MFS transporter [Planctomycetota bacterium]